MKVIKPLNSVPKASAHLFYIYHTHQINKLSMIVFTYDFCWVYTDGNDKSFKVVSLQTNNTLILANNIFGVVKEKELKKTKLLAKDGEKLTLHISIKFNGSYIRRADDNCLFFSQKR